MLTNLNTVDTPMLEETEFGPNAKQWLTTLVDTINTTFQSFAMLLAVGQINVGGSGAGPITVTVADLLSTNYVSAILVSSTNPNITIESITPANGSFNITFSADPGASAIIVYQAFAKQPQ